jgi:integrase
VTHGHARCCQTRQAPWNKGKLTGQKVPLRLKNVWAIRVRLQLMSRTRDLALFNLAIDSKRRGCDLVALRVGDVCHGHQVASGAIVMQEKTQRPVHFEISVDMRAAVERWIESGEPHSDGYLFPSRQRPDDHLSAREYARIVGGWIEEIGFSGVGTARTRCDG